MGREIGALKLPAARAISKTGGARAAGVLMTRMGHSTARAALIYQHMTADRDRAIADRLGAVIHKQQGDAGT